MKISRREFLLLTTGLVAGCKTDDTPVANSERVVNAGAGGNFAANRVYSNFRDQGFFVVRRDEKLFALSAICTHRKCKLTVAADQSYYCPCHGSTFDANGKVTTGPAKLDLPVLPAYTNEQGQLLVKVSSP